MAIDESIWSHFIEGSNPTDSLYHFLESIRNYFNIQISLQTNKSQFTDPNYMSCSSEIRAR